jgi:uncharacterized protein
LSGRSSLVIEVSQIPPEGMDVDSPLEPAVLGVEGEEVFALESGGNVSCHIEKTDDETVHVRGRLTARLAMDCGRCLERFALPIEQGIELFCLPHRPDDSSEDEEDLAERDIVVAYYRDGRLDLGEMIREQLFLSLPLSRVCRADCRGLCATCGANLNADSCGCVPAAQAPFSPLPKLLDKRSS